MGQHKNNPTAIAAKDGTLTLKPKRPKLSKREREALITALIYQKTGLGPIMQAMGERGVTHPFG